jgi:hypothetical protein
MRRNSKKRMVLPSWVTFAGRRWDGDRRSARVGEAKAMLEDMMRQFEATRRFVAPDEPTFL